MAKKTTQTSKTTTTVLSSEAKISTATKNYPSDWQEQIQQIITGMREHNIDVGSDRNAAGFENRMAELNSLDAEIMALETKLTSLRDNRQQKRLEFWQLASGTRLAVGGLYGTDSLQYQALGGTRASERKRPVRKPKTT